MLGRDAGSIGKEGQYRDWNMMGMLCLMAIITGCLLAGNMLQPRMGLKSDGNGMELIEDETEYSS